MLKKNSRRSFAFSQNCAVFFGIVPAEKIFRRDSPRAPRVCGGRIVGSSGKNFYLQKRIREFIADALLTFLKNKIFRVRKNYSITTMA